MPAILFVEDDTTIAMGVEYSLKQDGFQVQPGLPPGRPAQPAQAWTPLIWYCWTSVCRMAAGYELCKEIRAAGDTRHHHPLLCRDEEASIILGLDLGADDYLTKPFRLGELISRIKAVLRRRGPVEHLERTLTCGDVTVVAEQAKVYKNGREVLLTALEYRLLLALVANQGRVLTAPRSWPRSGMWTRISSTTTPLPSISSACARSSKTTRRTRQLIKTVRGLGYKAGD